MGEECRTDVERKASYRVSVGKTGGKKPLGRQWRRWEYNIKTYL